MMLQSSRKISFVKHLRDLSGKDWNPRQDRGDERFFFFFFLILENSNKVSSRRHLHLVSVSCSSSGVWLL